nr:MAG TPA_asm: hypothetical protein [Bacteriophage sp.]
MAFGPLCTGVFQLSIGILVQGMWRSLLKCDPSNFTFFKFHDQFAFIIR